MRLGAIGPAAASAASATLYALSFPPFDARAAAWIALVPFLVALRRVRGAGTAAVLTWLWTVVAAGIVGSWFPRAVAAFAGQPMWFGAFAFVAVTSLMAFPCYLVFAIVYRAVPPASPIAPAIAGAAWVTAELCRTELLTGNPWALAGYSQVGLTPLVQIADLAGVYGISFALVTVNAALASIALAPLEGRGARGIAGNLAWVIGLPSAVLLYGVLRLHGEPSVDSTHRARIGIVQGNVDVGTQWRDEFYGKNLDSYLRLTYQLLSAESPTVVIWPETSMTFFLDQEPSYRRAINRVTGTRGAQLLAGGPRVEGPTSAIFYNSAFLLSAEGEIVAIYDKQRLLPFTEYFPLRADVVRRNFGRVREFVPGRSTPPLETAAGRAGVMICNEAMFPAVARERVWAGADYLVNLSNETWVGDDKYAAIAFAMVSLRAVEQRRYLVRASTSGPSAIVDPYGRTIRVSAPGTEATLAGAIGVRSDRTVYARVGDAFAFGCVVVAAMAYLLRSRR